MTLRVLAPSAGRGDWTTNVAAAVVVPSSSLTFALMVWFPGLLLEKPRRLKPP